MMVVIAEFPEREPQIAQIDADFGTSVICANLRNLRFEYVYGQ